MYSSSTGCRGTATGWVRQSGQKQGYCHTVLVTRNGLNDMQSQRAKTPKQGCRHTVGSRWWPSDPYPGVAGRRGRPIQEDGLATPKNVGWGVG
eukprot:7435393-Pyramimonas_sp.AAC.1